MSNRAIRGFGWLLAGAVLVLIADEAPPLALAVTGVLVIGAALNHATEIQQLGNDLLAAIQAGQKGT